MRGETLQKQTKASKQSDGAGPVMAKTPWGYRLCVTGKNAGMMRITHAAGRFVGLVLLLVIAGVWSFSAHVFADPLILAMKLGLTGLLFVMGWILFWYGRDARQVEAQVDLEGRELRIGHKDGLNRFRPETCLPFSDIGSFLILRSDGDPRDAALYARIGSGMHAYEVIDGNEVALEQIKNQLESDLTSARRRRDPKNRRISPIKSNAISLTHLTAP